MSFVHLLKKNSWSQREMDRNLGLGDTSTKYMGYLWPYNIQSHLEIIFCTLVYKWPVSRKRLTIQRNGLKLGVRDAIDTTTCLRYLIWRCNTQSLFGVVRRCCLKTDRNSAKIIARHAEMYDSGKPVEHIGVPFI